MTFIVHGATGAQGTPVLSGLRAAGAQALAAVRTPSTVPGGVDAVPVDLADTDSLVRAYTGSDGVFVHLPMAAPDEVAAYARNVVAAIDAARPRRVVISTSGQVVDQPGSALQSTDAGPIMTLIRGAQATGVSTAVVAPRLYLENLLLPVVDGPVREEGVLRYPLPASCPVSWSSHLDVADAAVRLLTDPAVTGIVAVGHRPGLTGIDLAAGFTQGLVAPVRYEPSTPEAFGDLITPLFGAEAAASVAGLYRAIGAAGENVIDEAASAQRLLGLEPRPVAAWLAQVTG